MKTKLISILLLTLITCAHGQEKKEKRYYSTHSGEMIFSLANIKFEDATLDPILRWSPVFNFQNLVIFESGFFTGLNFHNVGFIYEVPGSNLKKKVRTYNFGVPLGLSFGDREGFLIYGGYELEIPINYKEKTFEGDEKTDKFNVWFSGRTNTLNHAFFVGVQFWRGTNIKFKYYLTNFYNQSYTTKDDLGVSYKPYENLDVNVFYFSLTFDMFRDRDYTLNKNRDNDQDNYEL